MALGYVSITGCINQWLLSRQCLLPKELKSTLCYLSIISYSRDIFVLPWAALKT